MPSHAEEHSHIIPTNRNCTVEITNVTGTHYLIKPKVHMESGFAFSPPQPTVCTNKTEICSFTKDDNTASGAVGVLTYDLFNIQNGRTDGMMAIMFSVPFDYNFYANWLGVGIFEADSVCDEKLFKKMYDDKGSFKRYKSDGSGLTYRDRGLDIRATMNDGKIAIVKLEIYNMMGS